jgi:threonine/homoserine/homoserine lactone efflux protein
MLLASGMNFGFRASVPHMLGISGGFFVLLLAVGFGLGEVFARQPLTYSVMMALLLVASLVPIWRDH